MLGLGRLCHRSGDPNHPEANDRERGGRRKPNDRQGVGFQGMLRAVVRPYRQNETDSKIVTASQRRALWSLPLQHCLSVRERLSVSGN